MEIGGKIKERKKERLKEEGRGWFRFILEIEKERTKEIKKEKKKE
jgi:hypothetical protein